MILKFKYSDDDYVELNWFINNERGVIKRGRIVDAIVYPLLLIIIILSLVDTLEEYIIIPIVIWIIFTVIWFIFHKDIYKYRVNKAARLAIKNPNLKGVEYFKDTLITLNDEGIKKEIEGITLSTNWESVEKVFVMEKNIFIRLLNASYINIPIRIFKNNEDKEMFLKFLDEHIKIHYLSIN